MGISGSLQDFSLPEILQIIDTGSKTGRLSISSSLKGKGLQNNGTNYLWFKKGNFVALSNPFKYNNILNLIKKENFVSSKSLIKLYSVEPNLKVSLGQYCLETALLNTERINILFEKQLAAVYSLFEADSGWFAFENANPSSLITEQNESFPLMEMTGCQREALTVSLQGMRFLDKLDARLTEQMPEPNSGFIRVADKLKYKLLPIEACLWDDANAQSSLKKIAQKTLFEIEDLQAAALRLILIGLIEEVSVAGFSSRPYTALAPERELALSSGNKLVREKVKSEVSNSLIGNLVKFLRNNF